MLMKETKQKTKMLDKHKLQFYYNDKLRFPAELSSNYTQVKKTARKVTTSENMEPAARALLANSLSLIKTETTSFRYLL